MRWVGSIGGICDSADLSHLSNKGRRVRKKMSSAPSSEDGVTRLEVRIDNVGALKSAAISLARITILAGPNGTGKTSALYSIYGLLAHRIARFAVRRAKLIARELLDKGAARCSFMELSSDDCQELLDEGGKYFTGILPSVLNCDPTQIPKASISLRASLPFAASKLRGPWLLNNLYTIRGVPKLSAEVLDPKSGPCLIEFKVLDASVEVDLVEKYVTTVLFDALCFPAHQSAYILPSERAGINLFYLELNSRRTALLHNLQKSKIDPLELLNDVMKSRYAKPVADYIDLLNSFVGEDRSEGPLAALADELDEIALGKFDLGKDGAIYFKPARARSKKLSLHLAASSAKSLYGFSYLLRHRLKAGDFLLIDEPELNLHPDAQRRLARVIARLAASGVSVILSTHSDYFIREIGLVMVDSNDQLIQPGDVELYTFSHAGRASRARRGDDGSFADDPFEDAIRDQNRAYLKLQFE